MRKLLLSFFCIASLWTYAQDKNGKSIEASLLARWDKHAHYTTRFGNRSYSEEVQLAGLSFGGNIATGISWAGTYTPGQLWAFTGYV